MESAGSVAALVRDARGSEDRGWEGARYGCDGGSAGSERTLRVVETQTVNYGAVRFYRSMGFAWCGFDTSLYDPGDAGVDEVALFFSRDL